MTSYVTSYVLNAAVPESEHGDADRHEMLDMDDYEYVPPHVKRAFDTEFLDAISGWQTCTKDKILTAVDKFDGETAVLQHSPKAFGLQEALKKQLIPELSPDAAGMFTRSEQFLQDYARKRTMNATELKALIQEVLYHPEFNADDVDSDMHARLMKAVADGDVEIHDLWKEGDGDQEVKLFTRDVEKVLRELLGDIRLAGNQHFEFKEYKDSKENRIFFVPMQL